MAEGLTAEGWRTLLDGVTDHTIGVEEELMLLDPATLDLLPAAATRARRSSATRCSLRPELPAAQVETASPVCATIAEAAAALAAARRALAGGVAGWARLAGAGTHPFAAPEGPLRDDPQYATLIAEFPWVLPRQLVFGLHVHVAVRGADRALAVSTRCAPTSPTSPRWPATRRCTRAATPASPRCGPKLCELLPAPGRAAGLRVVGGARGLRALGPPRRASSPPTASRGGSCARTTSWGRSSCACPTPRARPRTRPGVLAFARRARRVARRAPRRRRGAARCTTASASPRTAGARCATASTAALLDLDTGEPQPARARVLALIDAVAPAVERLGGAAELEHARTLAARNGAERQRAVAAEHGPRGVAEWLADAFLP